MFLLLLFLLNCHFVRIILIIGSYIFMIYKWLLGHTNLIFSLMGETMKNLGSVGRSYHGF